MTLLDWVVIAVSGIGVDALAWTLFIKPTRDGTVDKDPESQ